MAWSPAPGTSTITCGPITLDPENRVLYRDNEEHRLTPKEASLLLTFLRHRGEVLTRQFLMKTVWDTDFIADTRTLEVHVHWLRAKIERDGRKPSLLHTVRGVGYVFRPREQSAGEAADKSPSDGEAAEAPRGDEGPSVASRAGQHVADAHEPGSSHEARADTG